MARKKKKLERPAMLKGMTFKVRTNAGKLFMILNFHKDKPFEVFVKVGKAGDDVRCLCETIGQLVSLHLLYGTPTPDLIAVLRGIGGEGLLVPTVPDSIAKALAGEL